MKPQETKTEKKPYTSPTITVIGDIEAITLGFHTGEWTDAAFPVHTSRGDLTFS
jgi:hypothetical protein